MCLCSYPSPRKISTKTNILSFQYKIGFHNTITPLIILCYWHHTMIACHCDVWDEKTQINLVIWNMIFEFLSQLHESNLAYIFSLRMVLHTQYSGISHIWNMCQCKTLFNKISYNCLCKCVTKIEILVLLSLETKRSMFEYP